MQSMIEDITSTLWLITFINAFLSSFCIIVIDIKIYRTRKIKNGHLSAHAIWLMRLTTLFDTVLFFLYITGFGLEARSRYLGTSRHTWLCLASFCTLQLRVSTSVKRPFFASSDLLIRSKVVRFCFIFDCCALQTWIVYGILAVVTTGEVLIYILKYTALTCTSHEHG
jgi:hypothetical protein